MPPQLRMVIRRIAQAAVLVLLLMMVAVPNKAAANSKAKKREQGLSKETVKIYNTPPEVQR